MSKPTEKHWEEIESFHDKIKADQPISWQKVKVSELPKWDQNVLKIISLKKDEVEMVKLKLGINVYATGVPEVPYGAVLPNKTFIWFDKKDSIHPDIVLQIGLARDGINSKLILRDNGTSIISSGDTVIIDERHRNG